VRRSSRTEKGDARSGAEEDDPKVKCMFWKILTSGVALFLS
jgi:hypothetical protein